MPHLSKTVGYVNITEEQNSLTPTKLKPQIPHDIGTASREPAKAAKWAACSVPVNLHVGLIIFNKIM